MRRAAAAILATLLLVTGCTSSGPTLEEGHWRIELDESWTSIEPMGDPWTAAYESDGYTLQVAGRFSEDDSARTALARMAVPAMTQLPGFSSTDVEKIEVPGAYDAIVQRFTFTDDGEPREGAWIIATQWPYPSSAALTLTGEQVSGSDVERLLEGVSFAVEQE